MSEHEDSHSDEEDTGRLQSESLMRRKPTTKWLADVIEQAAVDYEECVEGIERESEMITTSDGAFLTSVEQVFQNEAVDEAGASTLSNNATAHNSTTTLLTASATLLDIYTRATTSTQLARASVEETWHEHNSTLIADRKLMKKILAAGKRMVEREIEGLDQPEGDDGEGEDDSEEVRQAKAIFNGREKDGGMGCRSGSGLRTLKYVEKGVRKMAKGLEE